MICSMIGWDAIRFIVYVPVEGLIAVLSDLRMSARTAYVSFIHLLRPTVSVMMPAASYTCPDHHRNIYECNRSDAHQGQ
jgi:hypothetical protein